MSDDFELDTDDLQRRMDGAMANLRTEFASLRTGRASASMLTQSVKGQSVERAQEIFDAFHTMLTEPDAELDYDILDDLECLAGVSEFPTRIKCAVLAWHTLRAALDGKAEGVTTE